MQVIICKIRKCGGLYENFPMNNWMPYHSPKSHQYRDTMVVKGPTQHDFDCYCIPKLTWSFLTRILSNPSWKHYSDGIRVFGDEDKDDHDYASKPCTQRTVSHCQNQRKNRIQSTDDIEGKMWSLPTLKSRTDWQVSVLFGRSLVSLVRSSNLESFDNSCLLKT